MADSQVVPFVDPVVESEGLTLSRSWQQFFRKIQDLVDYIDDEQSFTLVNNQAVAADLTPLTFDYRYTSQATIEYLIQRTSSSAEAVRAGKLNVIYLPNSNSWNIADVAEVTTGTPGITFTITSSGQVQYTSTNQAGTGEISRLVFRVREMKAKSSLYSQLG